MVQPKDTWGTCRSCIHYETGIGSWVCEICEGWDKWERDPEIARFQEEVNSYTGANPDMVIVDDVYPDDNPKTILGEAKPPITPCPPSALLHLGRAMADGKRKYGSMNWRDKRVSSNVYVDAAFRHLMAWWDGEEEAEDSGVHHLGHVMACMAILLDALSVGNLNDNRPTPGKFPELVKQYTQR